MSVFDLLLERKHEELGRELKSQQESATPACPVSSST
jgi:hypothetical protein